jgi:hypothetical protein
VNADFVAGAPPGQAEYASASAAGLERATQHKDKLMSFAANKAKRTSIIDDQSDFYDLFGSMDDAWLDQTERSERLLKAQAEHERLHQVQKQNSFLYWRCFFLLFSIHHGSVVLLFVRAAALGGSDPVFSHAGRFERSSD